MLNRSKKLFSLQLLCAVLMCTLFNISWAQLVREPRAIGAGVVILDVSGSLDVKVKQGNTPAMIVSTDKNRLPTIVTEQDGSTLRISSDSNWFQELKRFFSGEQSTITVELTLPAIQKLSLRGSGETTVTGFTGNQLQLASDGAGNIVFTGQYKQIDAVLQGSGNLVLSGGTNDVVNLTSRGVGNIVVSGQGKILTVSMSGAGNLEANTFLVDKVSLSMAGAGNAAIFARDTVSVSAQGVGNVNVYGNPPHQEISSQGVGEVRLK